MAINWKSPWVIGGIGVGLVLLLVASRGGGGGSDTGTTAVAANQTNAQLAQLSTGLQGAQLGFNNQLAITQSNNGAAMALAADQANYGITAALFSLISNGANNQTQLSNTSAQITGDITKSAITANATLQLAPELANIQASSNQALAKINEDQTLRLYPLVAQNQQMLTWLAGNTAISQASLNTQAVEAQAMANESIAGTYADAAVTKQLISTGGQIVSSAIGGGFGGGFGGGGGGGGDAGGGGGVATSLGGFF